MIDKMANSRKTPDKVDIYEIKEDGTLIENIGAVPDSYIDEFELKYLYYKEIALHVRKKYGRYIGVMRDVAYNLGAKEYKTSKMAIAILPKDDVDKRSQET